MDTHPGQDRACKNCGNSFTENFCNRCGQASAHRLSLAHIGHDFSHAGFHADKGVFPFIWRILYQPGLMAREFIDGKRRIFNPVQYLLISVGIIVFLMTKSHFFQGLDEMNSSNMASLSEAHRQKVAAYNEVIRKNTNLIALILLPLSGFFGWLFYRKKGHNYAEHVMIFVFSLCQTNTLNFLVLLIAIATGMNFIVITTCTAVLSLSSFCLVYYQVYKPKWYTAVGKGLAIYVLSYTAYTILSAIAMVIYLFS